ncbi:N-(5'-phosphoribosyl)anthranilate isomerase [Bordetella pertussis]|uniref:N-(5'-phosphoribosyl)anthranilate isomerase n=1 Tax=Bordetella pertussis (strain ATCC 9797 / DSM 5571 / CCUG 30873 / LMG 14455 / NCTC 10739 / 18323) TaxID=568706 RepID=A0A0T7CLT5_BORP1|nr:phosphoribosylanthranilate isomerase [Bordetella pertussis]AZR84310.1 N-(5'-phosphoribosyl)anthranilate isomerase [Bordetella pertussis]PNO95175.1 phosphoribosylanthranilate isomerase [Bordetella pertussis 18323]UEB59401.1 phosphoribosylanthranilate isomerase [Bordetella pertussis]CCJ62571.1 N-(5'-phosphoribosyl)anthranilate isomerase [Bordetella pertussis 18323]CFP49699.1 N-(5'-phosphoribosyl)anthranilate isomerase [Bordetella pertussis]
MRTRVKICGLTREQDIASAVQAGADAIGFVFYPASKRHVDPARAAQLRREVPAFVDVVALFVNPRPDEVQAVLDHVAPDLLQFHGDETPQDCGRYGRRYLRAFRAGAPGLDSAAGLAAACRQYADAAGWLFDSYSAGYGGSGQGFDHGLLAGVQADPASCAIVLAGGLHPGNVADAVRAVRPWAVDVSSGVEDAPGIKSVGKIRQLMAAIKSVDQVAR